MAAFVRGSGRGSRLPEREIETIIKSATRYAKPSNGSGPAFGAVTVRLADVEREVVEWLWRGRLPRGRLTGMIGDPGVGKSWLALGLTTAVTRGVPLPGDAGSRDPAGVLLLTAEDGLADTVRGRLEDMGADLTRVTALTAVPRSGRPRAGAVAC